MAPLKVNLTTIATNSAQIFHRLRWPNGVVCLLLSLPRSTATATRATATRATAGVANLRHDARWGECGEC